MSIPATRTDDDGPKAVDRFFYLFFHFVIFISFFEFLFFNSFFLYFFNIFFFYPNL